MTEINPDRARSRLQQMTNTQLRKLADRFHVCEVEGGRKLTRKRMISRLMLEDGVIEEYGAKGDEE
jgi:hypothetical protein